MIFKQTCLVSVTLFAGCVSTPTADNFKPRKPSISVEKSPIIGTVGYDLRITGDRDGVLKKGKHWEMGSYFGMWSSRGHSTDLLGIRTVSSSKATFTINGGEFTQPLSAECKSKSHKSNWARYKFKPNDLKYVCEFDDQTTRFEVVLQDHNSLLGALMNSRVGRVQHDGVNLSLEEHIIQGPKYSESPNEGYAFDAARGTVAGLDFRDRNDRSVIGNFPLNDFVVFLPPENDPNHKAAVVAAIALAFFDDPKRRKRCESDDDHVSAGC